MLALSTSSGLKSTSAGGVIRVSAHLFTALILSFLAGCWWEPASNRAYRLLSVKQNYQTSLHTPSTGHGIWEGEISRWQSSLSCLPDHPTLLLLVQNNGVSLCVCFTALLPKARGMLRKYWLVSFYHCCLQRNLANLSTTLSVIWQNNGPVLSNIWQSPCSRAGLLQSSLHYRSLAFKGPTSISLDPE